MQRKLEDLLVYAIPAAILIVVLLIGHYVA
jgi:hypothetical protein